MWHPGTQRRYIVLRNPGGTEKGYIMRGSGLKYSVGGTEPRVFANVSNIAPPNYFFSQDRRGTVMLPKGGRCDNLDTYASWISGGQISR